MTSWIRASPFQKKKVDEGVRPFFFKLDSREMCSQFNQYFYAKTYADSLKRPLIVYDKSNPVSVNFSLIHDTFSDVSGTTFTDGMVTNATLLPLNDMARIYPFIKELSSGPSQDELREKAATTLQWNRESLAAISALKEQNGIPTIVDIGIHIWSDDRRQRIDTSAYINSVKEITKILKKNDVTIFVASENSILLQDFMANCPKEWKVLTIRPATALITGFKSSSFERANQRLRTVAYNEFITNLACLQSANNLLTSLSSDVGRFLFMTNQRMNYFKSMDSSQFTPF